MTVIDCRDVESRIADEISQGRDDLVDLAGNLIGWDTTARAPADPPRQEPHLQEYLAGRLRAAGARVDLWEPEPDPSGLSFEGRPQLAATFRGTGGGRSLLFNGHVDVVTPEPLDQWTSDPWRAEVRDGVLYGRGACDMKGGIAAMVFAAETLARLGIRLGGDLILNTNTDEETSGAGSRACVAHGIRADAGICTEPTGGQLWVACRGSRSVEITVAGRAGHAELVQPEWQDGGAVNAIDKAELVLAAVRELRDHLRGDPAQSHPYLAPGTIVTTLISGGEWIVSYPANCKITANLLYLPMQADADGFGNGVAGEVERWVNTAVRRDPWLAAHPPRFAWGPDLPPFEVTSDHPIVRTVQAAAASTGLGLQIGALDSWFDAASFNRAGAAMMIGYGPGQIGVAHTIDEHVAVDDLVRCAQTLAISAVRWCGQAERTGP
jgi:acetylornithine deacetylase